MCEALVNDDLDGFFELAERRGTLIGELRSADHPSDVDPEWQTTADAMARQHETLTRELARQQERLQRAMGGAERYRHARQQYAERPGPSQILHRNVRG